MSNDCADLGVLRVGDNIDLSDSGSELRTEILGNNDQEEPVTRDHCTQALKWITQNRPVCVCRVLPLLTFVALSKSIGAISAPGLQKVVNNEYVT